MEKFFKIRAHQISVGHPKGRRTFGFDLDLGAALVDSFALSVVKPAQSHAGDQSEEHQPFAAIENTPEVKAVLLFRIGENEGGGLIHLIGKRVHNNPPRWQQSRSNVQDTR